MGARHRRPGRDAPGGKAGRRGRLERGPADDVRSRRARVHRRAARLRSRARGRALERLRARSPGHARAGRRPMRRALARLAPIAAAALAALACPVPAHAEEGAPIALVHALVYGPGAQGPIADATIVIASGKVQAVGTSVAVPAGAQVIDAHGKTVTAGFIDADTDVGVVEVDLEPGSNDTASRGLLVPALRMVDGYNPRSALIPIARAGGVTSVMV